MSFRTIKFQQGKQIVGSEKTFDVNFQIRLRDDVPDVRLYLRWRRYSYDVKSDYPYLKQLPSYEKVPFLIESCANRRCNSSVAYSQLVALTRVDFGEMRATDDTKRSMEIESWRDWWKNTGEDRGKQDEAKGEVDSAAWQLVARNRKLEVPTTSISLPDVYTMEWSFRSGDYQGVVNESLTLKRSNNGASLIRVFSTKTGGGKTTEVWQSFTVEDADRTARAIGYLIDNPWLIMMTQK